MGQFLHPLVINSERSLTQRYGALYTNYECAVVDRASYITISDSIFTRSNKVSLAGNMNIIL